jgi:hypothetical protein
MPPPVAVMLCRINWNNTAIKLGELPGRWHELHIGPEPEHPFGRKGAALLGAWHQLQQTREEAGIVILDGDVAIDPLDQLAMMKAVTLEPDVVHTAPVRLWPKSTQWGGWTWGHHRGQPGQESLEDPTVFSFNFTYLPRRLLAICKQAGMARWTFPNCDSQVCTTAARNKIPVRVVHGASPKHLHY